MASWANQFAPLKKLMELASKPFYNHEQLLEALKFQGMFCPSINESECQAAYGFSLENMGERVPQMSKEALQDFNKNVTLVATEAGRKLANDFLYTSSIISIASIMPVIIQVVHASCEIYGASNILDES